MPKGLFLIPPGSEPLGIIFTMEDHENEELYDEVTGGRGKPKRVLDALNKSKLSKHEMDELFCNWE